MEFGSGRCSQEIRTQNKEYSEHSEDTKAMEMVAASKMRKAVNQMEMARPYADKISEVMTHLANAHPEYDSAFFDVRTTAAKTLHRYLV